MGGTYSEETRIDRGPMNSAPRCSHLTRAPTRAIMTAKDKLVRTGHKTAGSIGVWRTLGRRPPCRVSYTPGKYRFIYVHDVINCALITRRTGNLMPRKIPYAVANYEEIVTGGYHFVDKTRFIRELEQYKIPVFLRPRRFGKSLWCSILECYYDINRADRFKALFGQSDIGLNPTPSRSSQLVLRFDFSKIPVEPELPALKRRFDDECWNSFEIFLAEYRTFLPGTALTPDAGATAQLAALLRAIRVAKAPPVHIIIDEYDNFTNQLLTAQEDELYRNLTTGDSFLRTFYKVIKAGVGDGSVERVFVTGVLPVTMDDLTSGFNIGQVITLEENVLNMMGFTQAEVDHYVDAIFAEHDWPSELRCKVGDDLRTHYNGYRFLPDAAELLYNSTICNFYLNKLVINDGKLPLETIDHNLRVDVNWLRRLARGEAETRALLETLMYEGSLSMDMAMLQSTFNIDRFFDPGFLPLSLYYLGMLTFQDEYTLRFPNLTVKTLFTQYFNEIEGIEVSTGYTEIFRRFQRDHDLKALFDGYWQRYVGQIPAQAFDKLNENFFRTTFFELCTRHLFRHLMFAIEVNHPTGRSDWEAIGRPHTGFADEALILEFKHFTRTESERLGVPGWTEARPADIAQVTGYADDVKHRYPQLTVRRHVVYTVVGEEPRFFALD